MRSIRVYVDRALAPDSRVRLDGSAANHVLRVLRLGAGDALTVFDGRGGEYDARIGEPGKSALTVEIGGHRPVDRESRLAVTLAQGVCRGERMDLVVQKATELGVRRIVPVLTERAVVRFDARQREARLRHWRGVAVAACEQCGRNVLPQIEPPVTLQQFLALAPADRLRLLLAPDDAATLRDLELESDAVTLLIGPEGGLSRSERRAALDAGFRAVGLGPRVLRTETAAIAAITAVQLLLGDL